MSQKMPQGKQPLIRYVNRQQMSWRAVDVNKLIAEDHRARAIWALVGSLNLTRFYEEIASSAEEGGRPAFDPQMLISVWVYAYSEGIGTAREVARRCEFDPAFQWLTGLQEVNYHTLADFRVEKQQELDELFTQVLAALSDGCYRKDGATRGREWFITVTKRKPNSAGAARANRSVVQAISGGVVR
jgi:transposase